MNLFDLQKEFPILFSSEEFKRICYHSSYQPQEPNMRRQNKAYTIWGRYIIEVAYASYLFINEDGLNAEEFTNEVNKAYSAIREMVYQKYNLEECVIKSKSEESGNHSEIVPKLIALIYHMCGFEKVYDFLMPMFIELKKIVHIDYKTLIGEYAQKYKLPFSYEIVDVSGPDHELKYTCKLSVGNRSSVADAIGKRNATKAAAKQFVLQYGIQTVKSNKSSRKKKNRRQLTSSRRNDLEVAMKILRVDDRYITFGQMDEALVHSSYSHQHLEQGLNSNDCASILGARVLMALCAEYVLENYDLEKISLPDEIGVILNENNFSGAIPQEILTYLLRSGNFELEKNRAKMRFKIQVLKSVVGFLWLNAVTQKKHEIFKYVKLYVHRYFSKEPSDKGLNYYSFLLQLIDKYKWEIEFQIGDEGQNFENSQIYVAELIVSGPQWKVEGRGSGTRKIIATNLASKDILNRLLPHCTSDSIVEEAILRMLDPELQCIYKAKKTPDKKILFNKTEISQSTSFIKKESLMSQDSVNVPREVSFDCSEHTLYICKGTMSCRKDEHEIISATGILASLSGRMVKINVNYCKNCGVYFIGAEEYKYYRGVYGVLLGNIAIRQRFNSDWGYNGMLDESILHICGYTVNQKDGLSCEERRLILGSLMDRGVIGKYRIMEYLQFFINNSKYRHNMHLANEKWSADLKWVRDYQIDKQRKYIIDSIKKW